MQQPLDGIVLSCDVVVDLAEEDSNRLILSNATVVLPGVVYLDHPHDHQSCNAAKPAQHKAQLAHVLQVNALQQMNTSQTEHHDLC